MSKFNESYKEYYKIVKEAQVLDRVKLKRDHSDYEYFENHHIIPESLGGSNSWRNMVLLTPEEHYICHSLLPDFCEGKNKAKMMYAWNAINGMGFFSKEEHIKIIGSKKYADLKRNYSANMSGGQSPVAKEIYQLDKDTGETIKKWSSIIEAAQFLNISEVSISACSRKEQKTAGGFCWTDAQNLDQTVKDISLGLKKKVFNSLSIIVYQLDKDTGKIIKEWSSVTLASSELKINMGCISACIHNYQKTAGGFCWTDAQNLDQTVKDISLGLKKVGTKAKEIYQLDKDTGETIKKWSSAKEAGIFLKISSCSISTCVRKEQKTAGGFCWTDAQNLDQTVKDISLGLKKKNQTNKRIYQLDKDTGKIIKEWSSAKLAEETLGINNISACLNGHQKTAGKFRWEFVIK